MGKRFRRAVKAGVQAELERRVLRQGVTVRTLTICFRDKTVDIGGRVVSTEMDCLAIPLLSTEVAVYPPNGGRLA